MPKVQDLTMEAARSLERPGWKVFVLVAHGIKFRPNIELCPETWHIPGLKTAMFSIFEPGRRLPPHRRPYNSGLRLHLGLLDPEPRANLAIRIGPETRQCADLRRRF